MSSPALRAVSQGTRFALCIAFCYLVAASAAAWVHELWRDETHAWLIARDATGPLSLLRNLRYDGHPCLWHLCLWPLTRLGGPELMKVLAVAIGTINAFLFARYAPFPRLARGLFAFGYLQLWEWGAIARNYGIGVLFLLVTAILMVRRERYPILIGATLALAANTAAFVAVVVGGLLAMLVVERLAPWRQLERAAPPVRFWAGIALGTAGILACAAQVRPPPDCAVGEVWRLQSAWDHLGAAIASPVHGLASLPWGGPLESWTLLRVVQIALGTVIASTLAVGAGMVLARRRGAWIAYALPALALVVIFFLMYYGGARHAGFILISLLLALWVAPTYPQRPAAPAGRLGRTTAWAESHLNAMLAAAFAFQVGGSVIEAVIDGTGVYSAAGATAELIRAQGLAHLPMVADPDAAAANVLAQLDKDVAFYENVQRWGSFAIWDSRHAHGGTTLLSHAPDAAVFSRARSFAERTDLVVLLDHQADPEVVSSFHGRLVGARHADIRRDESYWVYVVASASIVQR